MANTYLTRTPTGSATQTGTFSSWIKRSKLGGDKNTMISGYVDGSNYTRIHFRSDDSMQIYATEGGSAIFNKITNRLFRDTSAWYHIVVAFDLSNSTAEDRIKIYINGVRETSFSTNSNPSNTSKNIEFVNSNGSANIGNYASSDFFNGSMSHIHYIDATAYDASAFGETDATTGEWVGKTSPSVTYGTNGFFILKDGNGITDQSGEGNDFTLGGGTLTDLKDNPENVFATMNSLDNYFAGSTFTNGNNTIATGSSQATYNTGTLGVNTGKFYWEVKVSSLPSSVALIGIASKLTTATGTTLGTNANDYAIYSYNGNIIDGGNSVSYGNSFTTNDIIGVALDVTNSKLYFRKNNDAWMNSGNPESGSTGTGAVSIVSALTTPTGFYFPSAGDWSGSNSLGFQFNFGNGYFGTTAITTNSGNGYAGAEGASKFNYTVPTGYSALSTKGLNL